MEQIKKTLEQISSQAPQPSKEAETSETYEGVELTAEEQRIITEAALAEARRRKYTRMQSAEYWKKFNAEKVYPKYDPTELAVVVLQRFYERNGRNFVIDQDNLEVFELLCQYFTGDAAFQVNGYSLQKGILLYGDVGTGKTELLKMFGLNQVQSFGLVSCRAITDSFTDDGGEEVEKYYTNRKNALPHAFGQQYSGYCFDDLGTEATTVMHYGNKKNMMSEIILNRYDSKMDYKYTHITTNLTVPEIIERYGTRCTDRMRQMFNIITFPKGAKSRR